MTHRPLGGIQQMPVTRRKKGFQQNVTQADIHIEERAAAKPPSPATLKKGPTKNKAPYHGKRNTKAFSTYL